MAPHVKGIIFIIAGTVFWGASGVLSQHLFNDKAVTAEWLVTARLVLSGLVLLLIDVLSCRGSIFSIWRVKKDAAALAVFGILGMLGVQYTYFVTIVYSNAATSTILQYLMPVVIVIYITFTTRRLPRRLDLFSIALAMFGVFLLITKGRFDTLMLSPAALGWGLATACFAAFYTLQPRALIRKWRSTLVIGWGMLIGGIAMLPFQPIWQFDGVFDTDFVLTFAAVVLFGTALAFCAYLESTKYLSPTEISVFASLEPLSSIVLSIVFLGVSFGAWELAGAAVIIAAVTLLSK